MKSWKKVYWLFAAVVMISISAAGVFAQQGSELTPGDPPKSIKSSTPAVDRQGGRHPLGDVGKPADYDLTIRHFSKEYHDFSAFAGALPSAWNWKDQGMVTSAKDQKGCGGCWAFASTGALESKLLMAGFPTYDLSEQQQISCNTAMGGCSGGNVSALRFWDGLGPMEESCTGYPSYNGSVPECSTLSGCTELDERTTGYYTVDVSNVANVKTSLYNDGPAYFRFDVYTDFDTYWETGTLGHVYTQRIGAKEGGHAVLLIGWDDVKQAWLLKNSWGATSGPNGDGTFWMAYAGHTNDLYFGVGNVQVTAPPEPCEYTVQTIPYNFIDISSTQPNLGLGDDDVAVVDLPFTFTFYCKDYTSVTVDSNGLLHFLGGSSAGNNACLPSSNVSEPVIAPFWDDLDASTGGVYAGALGSAPNRTAIIQWKNVVHKGGTDKGTFEAVLYEGSNQVEFHYADVSFGAGYASGLSATVGVQRNSSEAVQYSCNTASLQDFFALRFSPPSVSTGALQVNLGPAGAVTAGAKWRVDGGSWQASGATVSSLSAGSHAVQYYQPVTGYTPPADESVSITAGQTTAISRTYAAVATGAIQVNLGPAEAVTAGAKWRVDGGSWQAGGATVSSLSAGSHSVQYYQPVTGYTPPADESVSVTAGQTTAISRTYSAAATGAVQVNLGPAGAVTAGAKWRVDGGSWQASGAAVSSLSPGSHSVEYYQPVTGYTPPADESVSVTAGQTTSISRTYASAMGAIQVTIAPPEACSAGAMWSVDGGSWNASGILAPNLPAGQHVISFKAIPNWTAPQNQTATITAGQTTSLTGNYAPLLAADFTGTPTEGKAGLKVAFTDASKGSIASWRWDFGDNTSSSQKNPKHAYKKAGTYTVSLTVTGSSPGAGTNTLTRNGYITVYPPPTPAFSANPATGMAPLEVAFTDESQGAVSGWAWNFGDNQTSAEQNPHHTYSKAGTYAVRLTAIGPGGQKTLTKKKFVSVTPNPTAEFTADVTQGTAPLDVVFTDASQGTVQSWLWSFGDKKTSAEQNPHHTYEKAGAYTVKLTVKGPEGTGVKSKTKYIKATLTP